MNRWNAIATSHADTIVGGDLIGASGATGETALGVAGIAAGLWIAFQGHPIAGILLALVGNQIRSGDWNKA